MTSPLLRDPVFCLWVIRNFFLKVYCVPEFQGVHLLSTLDWLCLVSALPLPLVCFQEQTQDYKSLDLT